jgi:hypothetical protein
MDYIVLIGSIVFLLIYFWIDRKNLENFFYKDEWYDRFNVLRVYFILILGIILFALKILKKL